MTEEKWPEAVEDAHTTFAYSICHHQDPTSTAVPLYAVNDEEGGVVAQVLHILDRIQEPEPPYLYLETVN
jgi:hypothetical protein